MPVPGPAEPLIVLNWLSRKQDIARTGCEKGGTNEMSLEMQCSTAKQKEYKRPQESSERSTEIVTISSVPTLLPRLCAVTVTQVLPSVLHCLVNQFDTLLTGLTAHRKTPIPQLS